MSEIIKELLERKVTTGTRVTNCILHMNLSILERPSSCKLCAVDIVNHLSLAIKINEWLNTWKDDATKVLKQS